MKIRNLFGKKELTEKELEELSKIESISKNELSKEILESWYKIHSEGYWVGEQNGEIVAYAYFIRLNARDIITKKRWELITENGVCKTHKKDGNALFLATLGSKTFSGESSLMRGIFKEIDKGFYEKIYGIYACSRVPSLNKKNNLPYSEDSMIKLFKKNKFMIVNIEEEKLNKDSIKNFNILVKRGVYGDDRLKLIWRRTWC